ncbi:hypothetical protein SKAU_G00049270 [Synaphobranchus kaupii]|uniref:Transmembrane 4 L6 family member 1 n=1 Tax=Synaphobranchus kaupii TaxID=118154 RepID=A0A9Q1G2P7_SYNKA|nr:hypothetical protein SKAU_G00049270 [Synaphobranchus kaupii]
MEMEDRVRVWVGGGCVYVCVCVCEWGVHLKATPSVALSVSFLDYSCGQTRGSFVTVPTNMCSKSFTRSLGIALIPLAVCCIIANVLLYFPNAETKYVQQDHLSTYVWFFTGIAGGGVLMIVPVLVFVNLERCANCCASEGSAMCSSVLAALVGLAGAGYCFVISNLALMEGPYCLYAGEWQSPFTNQTGDYLFHRDTWSRCVEPPSIVEWNITLFSILLGLSGLECIICAVQLANGLVAAVCRPCCYKQRYSLNA